MKYLILVLLAMVCLGDTAYSQVELSPWGNITGIRKQGQLFGFETSLQLVKKDGMQILTTARERQRPIYQRNGNLQTVTTQLDSLFFEKTVKDEGDGKAEVTLKVTSHIDTTLTGVYFVVRLPKTYNKQTQLKFIDNDKQVNIAGVPDTPVKYLARTAAKGFEYKYGNTKIKVKNKERDLIVIRKDENTGELLVYFPIKADQLKKGEIIQKTYELEAKGDIEKSPVTLTLNSRLQGRQFEGLGGNFRLQNPQTDPQVIDYSLNNLRIAWGRVELPWRLWQPERDVNPMDIIGENKLPMQVTQAMEMAQRLSKKGIPIILSVWSAPDWAIVGPLHPEPVNGIWGNPISKDVMTDIYRSLTRYITILKEKYGVEIQLFSFNESDLGINVRMTAQEHSDFIKGFGAYLKAKGLKTKLMLGDNSDATSIDFIKSAMTDEATKPYIGAVSFHSWRGWETETLQKWGQAAQQLNVPLLISEGSIDASAWQYPVIFQEPTYALDEINLYIRMLAICQPEAILQWQLTADYSPLAGGGIFGDNGPLRPTQRFWNLKQLSLTPANLYAMPLTNNEANISCAALGNNSTGTYAIHLVNNGAERQINLTGLPARAKKMQLYITNTENNAKASGSKTASNGHLQFKLPARSYVTLITE